MTFDLISFLEESLLIERRELSRFISSSPHRYKIYEIPKRNGKGTRTIAHPSRELKYVQRLLAKEYFSELPVHDAATAYRKGSNIRDNARRHEGAKYLLKMDFKDFFPSIRPPDLVRCLGKAHKTDIDELNSAAVASLFFYRANRKTKTLRLSIGAPTSPVISNAVMYDFDTELSTYASASNVAYSRYADDLAFSCSEQDVLRAVEAKVAEVVKKMQRPRLRLNSDKTVHLSSRHNMHLTGLVLTSAGAVSIGRQKKREIKSLVHLALQGVLDEERLLYLRGYLAYCAGVDPDFIINLQRKYGVTEVEDVMAGTRV
jgi:RNA-directed DNA polymerase